MTHEAEVGPQAVGADQKIRRRAEMRLEYDDAISRGEVKPIILFGAPRSGTQMYRDMICSHADVSTWPYNEMTYMWRYGNRDYPTDEIPVSELTDKTARYIRNSFIKLAEKSGSSMVLDKTCHNCLRPEYVQAVLPEAKYIYLVRHAMDVVPSTIKRSETPPPYREYARVFSIPLTDVPHYVKRAVWNHGGLFRPGNSSVRIWGPKFTGMNELAEVNSMQEVYAYQWLRHMELTDQFLNDREFDAPLLRVRYEEITKDPSHAFEEVYDYLGLETPPEVVAEWIDKVTYRAPGGGGASLGEHEASVRAVVAEKNAEHGYE